MANCFFVREVRNDGLLVIRNGGNSFYSYGGSVATACICSFPETIALVSRYIILKQRNSYFA